MFCPYLFCLTNLNLVFLQLLDTNKRLLFSRTFATRNIHKSNDVDF